jgi:hypothetical protein
VFEFGRAEIWAACGGSRAAAAAAREGVSAIRGSSHEVDGRFTFSVEIVREPRGERFGKKGDGVVCHLMCAGVRFRQTRVDCELSDKLIVRLRMLGSDSLGLLLVVEICKRQTIQKSNDSKNPFA